MAEEEKVPQEQKAPETGATAPAGKIGIKFDRKKKVRLIVTVIAAAIALTFFGLSYNYFSAKVGAIIFAALLAGIALGIVTIFKDWETPYKLTVTVLYIAAVLLLGYFVLQKSGLFGKIDSKEKLQEYIENSGGIAEIVFVVINFLQVTIIPIPSSITTTVGAVIFDGIWKPLYLTVSGILVGSMFAFFLGRVFGVRFANWLVGEKTIAKYKKITKGRDKIVLFYMFLFPFFPDDFLCILAGMTDFTYLGFFVMQVFCRTIGVLGTILMAKGVFSIPLQGWWLLLWGVLIAGVIVLLILTIRYSEKIEAFTLKIIDKLTFGFAGRHHLKKVASLEEKDISEDEGATEAAGEAPAENKGEKNDIVEHKSDSV